MTQALKRTLFLSLGCLFVLLGLTGIVLPILPTTPFMILATACFARSSPRFHQLLLNNRWIGKDLRRWESTRTMARATKKRATIIIIITFLISILLLWGNMILQTGLFLTGALLLFFLWRITEHT